MPNGFKRRRVCAVLFWSKACFAFLLAVASISVMANKIRVLHVKKLEEIQRQIDMDLAALAAMPYGNGGFSPTDAVLQNLLAPPVVIPANGCPKTNNRALLEPEDGKMVL
jgi:hypothetical protein